MRYYETAILEIRIEPDWNVKVFVDRPLTRDEKIRIEPDWNVKCQGR